jgi:deazaflavin-dependent oxidoreductase (nitroreductase family)
MVNLRDAGFKAVTRFHRAIFDVSNGRVGGKASGMPVLRLTTTGRRSYQPRDTMLTAPIYDDNRVVLVASFGGADHHPSWYLNLRQDPKVTVTMNGRQRSMIARTAGPEEKAEVWRQIVSAHKNYAGHQRKTDREIPVVILEPPESRESPGPPT